MLYYALVFTVVALLASLLGLGLLAGVALEIARVLFFLFLILFMVSLFNHASRGSKARKHV